MKRPHFFESLLLWLTPWRRKSRRYSALSAARKRRSHGASDAGGIADFLAGVDFPRVALAFGTAILLAILLCIHLWPNRVNLRLGQTADHDIIAQRTVLYEDTEATRQLRDNAVGQVEKRYDPLPTAAGEAEEAVGAIIDIVARWAIPGSINALPGTSADLSPEQAFSKRLDAALHEIRQQGTDEVTRADVAQLMRASEGARSRARQVATGLVQRHMADEIRKGTTDLDRARAALVQDPDLGRLEDSALRTVVARVAASALTFNRVYNERQTAADRAAAAARVVPQMRRIAAGNPIVRQNEAVTQQHLDTFAALGLQNARFDALTVAAITLLVAALTGLVAVFLRQFERRVYDDTPRMVLLALLALLSVTGLKIGQMLLGFQVSGNLFGYLGMMCVASAGMAIAVLIRPSVALLTVSLLSVVSGLVLNNELRFTVITLGSSLVGIVAVAALRHRGDFLRATLILCGANSALNVLVGHLEADPAADLVSAALWGGVSGLFALALFYTGVAAFERWFGITTHLRLLEMTDPARPVLQEFRMRVPGTYAHSLMVANLAHAAAEAIGADALLVRVAAYYHDLGKMNRPEFFIENQSNADNIHDRLSPYMSALVITSHVKEGMEMAEAAGLPPRVLEVIEQHHGTTLIRYFYHRATGGRPDPRLESQFRYPGPKPQSKEAAILMLADTVEAASRTLERPTPQRIADFVAELIEEKRADGQLDECDLTIRDLKAVQDVFTRTLSATLHARIAYPQKPKAAAAAIGADAGDSGAAPPPLRLTTFPEEALAGALTAAAAAAGTPDGGNGTGTDGTHDTNGAGGGGTATGTRGGGRTKVTRGRR